MDMEILVFSLQESDFSVFIGCLNLILPRESINRPHVDSSFHPPSDVIFL